MDGWLKVLVAAACCVVIAGGGYLGWREWDEVRRQRENAKVERARLVLARERLFALAEATVGDEGKVVVFCRMVDRDPSIVIPKSAAPRVVDDCRDLGYI